MSSTCVDGGDGASLERQPGDVSAQQQHIAHVDRFTVHQAPRLLQHRLAVVRSDHALELATACELPSKQPGSTAHVYQSLAVSWPEIVHRVAEFHIHAWEAAEGEGLSPAALVDGAHRVLSTQHKRQLRTKQAHLGYFDPKNNF